MVANNMRRNDFIKPLTHELLKNVEREIKEIAPPPLAIAKGVTTLLENFRSPKITVNYLANLCFVSEVYFRRLFHKHFGCSPLQMLLDLRFNYATQLLSSGYYTHKQVAMLSGFSDVKYFRTAYRKRFGKTLSEVISSKNGIKN